MASDVAKNKKARRHVTLRVCVHVACVCVCACVSVCVRARVCEERDTLSFLG